MLTATKSKETDAITIINSTERLPTPQVSEFIYHLVAERQKLGRHRFWGSINTEEGNFFIKTTHLSSLTSRLRVTFGLRRRSGAFDWPVAELRNSVKVNRLTSITPRLLAYSHIKGRFGLVNEVVLIIEDQTGFLNGAQWLKSHSSALTQLVPRLIDCILELNSQSIYHLDLWLGNFMLSDSPAPIIKVIDFENCFLRETPFTAETLGYQLGLLFEFKLHDYIDEASYDQLVIAKLESLTWLDRKKFSEFYEYFKRHGAGRKERYLIPRQGQLIKGKPTNF